jgi:hypothetical protein
MRGFLSCNVTMVKILKFLQFCFLELLVKGQRRLRKLGKGERGANFMMPEGTLAPFRREYVGWDRKGLKALFVSLAGCSPRESLGCTRSCFACTFIAQDSRYRFVVVKNHNNNGCVKNWPFQKNVAIFTECCLLFT